MPNTVPNQRLIAIPRATLSCTRRTIKPQGKKRGYARLFFTAVSVKQYNSRHKLNMYYILYKNSKNRRKRNVKR